MPTFCLSIFVHLCYTIEEADVPKLSWFHMGRVTKNKQYDSCILMTKHVTLTNYYKNCAFTPLAGNMPSAGCFFVTTDSEQIFYVLIVWKQNWIQICLPISLTFFDLKCISRMISDILFILLPSSDHVSISSMFYVQLLGS